MRIHVLTLFPEALASPLAVGPTRRARELGVLALSLHQLRDYTSDRHGTVDDVPYGGGQGMVLKVEPLVRAIEHVTAEEPMRRVLLSARGTPLTQDWVVGAAREPALLLVCGRYEGIDERVREWVDEELSIGDYVLAGGETAAAVVIEAVARLLPGAVGNAASTQDESFSVGLLEYPQYTRPHDFRGRLVPDVLRAGDHEAVARWRREQALAVTAARRPELLDRAPLSPAERATFERVRGSTGKRDG